MPYYIASYVGSGRLVDPFRPYRSDSYADWSAIDLRPNGGATLEGDGLNACLLWLPDDLVDVNLYKVALDKLDTVPVLVRNGLKLRLGLTEIADTRFDRIVAAFMLAPPANGWKPVRAGTRSRQIEISLGPLGDRLLYQQPVIAGGITITENFNKADNGLGPNLTWTEWKGTGWRVLSNQARGEGDDLDPQRARAETDLATDDHYAQAVIVAMTGANYRDVEVICRKDGTATDTFYQLIARLGEATDDHQLYKTVANADTLLGTDTVDPAAGETFRLEVDGSTLQGFRNGAALSFNPVTDTAIVGNLRTGIGTYTRLVHSVDLDSFEAGDLATALDAGAWTVQRAPSAKRVVTVW